MSTPQRSLTIAEVAQLTGAAVSSRGEGGVEIRKVSAIHTADRDSAVFAQDEPTLRRALASQAAVVLAAGSLDQNSAALEGVASSAPRVLWVGDARLAFALVARALASRGESRIDPSAVIASTAQIGRGAQIGPGVVVEGDVIAGDDVLLEARVVLHRGVRLGDRVEVHAGCVLGGVGFGWAKDPRTGEYVRFPQQGHLIVEDDVCIGANCTIDRGALDDTRIGAGTKIDNLVHIAHSCRIGRRVVIAAQTGIAGSSVVGDDAVIAGQVGIADHVEIGDGVVLGAKCGVPSNKVLRGPGQVFWGIPARPIQQYLRELAQLRRGLARSGR